MTDYTPDLRLGRWQDVLQGVECDALICDPPYGAGTHAGHNAGVGLAGRRRELTYGHWTPGDVAAFVSHWSSMVHGWMVCFTSDDLIAAYRAAFRAAGRLDFAPVPWVAHGSRVRLQGDGPSSWTAYVMVARPRTREAARWGTLPGAYLHGAANHGTKAQGAQSAHIGGKPLDLMRAIVRDYSRPGDLVCDPCAGGGTTLLAACLEGRRSIGAEMDQETHAKATARLHPETPLLDWGGVRVEQGRLDLARGARG